MKKNKLVVVGFLLISVLLCVACSNSKNVPKSKEWKNAMETYKKFLAQGSVSWITEDFAMDESIKFMTKDINEDGVPELFLLAPYRDVRRCESYTVVSDGMMELDAFDEFNGYYPGTGVFSCKLYENDHTFDQGGETWFYYMDDSSKYSIMDLNANNMAIGLIKNAFPKIERPAEYHWGGILIEGNEDMRYEKFKQSISETDFYTNLKELIGDTELVSIAEEWIDNTEENRNAYLK